MCDNRGMARGWESKSVEAQMEATGLAQEKAEKKDKADVDLARSQARKDLELSRIRISNDLQSATNPNHRKSLEAALAHLDKKISEVS
jgi:hypothetical protein